MDGKVSGIQGNKSLGTAYVVMESSQLILRNEKFSARHIHIISIIFFISFFISFNLLGKGFYKR